MRADLIKTGQYYDIQGVDGPRYLKVRRFPTDGEPSWEFYDGPKSMAQGGEPLIVRDPAAIVRVAGETPASRAEAWGAGKFDQKIFGLDGKNEEAVSAAIRVGYRCFDAAKTYTFTVARLAATCSRMGLARRDYKVVYKVGHGSTAKPLDEVIGEALATLGYIDVLMVHEGDKHTPGHIRTINEYIAAGLVKTGGLSNVAGSDLAGMDISELRHMVMLQDSIQTIMEERQFGVALRPKEKLHEAGVEVNETLYGLHGGIQFTPEEADRLRQLGVDETTARMIWARHHGFGEVASSSKSDRIAQNFRTPDVSKTDQEIVDLIDRKLKPSEEDANVDVVEEKSEPQWLPGLKEIYQAATYNAQSNNIEGFIGALVDIQSTVPNANRVLKHFKLKLTSSDPPTDRIYQTITWDALLKPGEVLEAAACNKKQLLGAIAAAVKEYNDQNVG
jgi:diketogulonate reductase-like aldo/keto reductase